MKTLGKVLLIIAGVLFLVSAAWNVISIVNLFKAGIANISAGTWVATIIDILIVIVCIFAGIGAITYSIGVGPFKKWATICAWFMLGFFIADLVFAIINIARGADVWNSIKNVIPTGIAEIFYVVGYFMARKK